MDGSTTQAGQRDRRARGQHTAGEATGKGAENAAAEAADGDAVAIGVEYPEDSAVAKAVLFVKQQSEPAPYALQQKPAHY